MENGTDTNSDSYLAVFMNNAIYYNSNLNCVVRMRTTST